MDIKEILVSKLNFKPYVNSSYEVAVGTVLKLKDGSIRLVGDVNTLLGICDDCTEFSREDIMEIAHIEQIFIDL